MGVWLGEAFRDVVYGQVELARLPEALLDKPLIDANQYPGWLLYSGLFVLLKQKRCLPRSTAPACSLGRCGCCP